MRTWFHKRLADDPLCDARVQEALRRAPTLGENDVDWSAIQHRVFAELDAPPRRSLLESASRTLDRLLDATRTPSFAWGAATCCIVAVAAGVWWYEATRFVPRITFSAAVQYQAADGTWRPAASNQPLRSGVTYQVPDRGLLSVKMQEDVDVMLWERTGARASDPGSHHAVLSLDSGRVAMHVARHVEGRHLQVLTPNAACEVVGTIFQVDSRSPDGVPTTVLTVEKGTVRFSPRGRPESFVMVSGPASVALTGDSMGVVAPVPAPDILQRIQDWSDAPAADSAASVTGPSSAGPQSVDVASPVQPPPVAMPEMRQPSSPTAHAGDSAETGAQVSSREPPPSPDTVPAGPPRVCVPVALPPAPVKRHFAPAGVPWRVSGRGRALQGSVVPAILRLSCDPDAHPWAGSDMTEIAEFVAQNTELEVNRNWPVVSFDGAHSSFGHWLSITRRLGTRTTSWQVSGHYIEQAAMDALGTVVVLAADRDFLAAGARLTALVGDFARSRFGVRIDPEASGWVRTVSQQYELAKWEEQYLRDAELSVHAFLATKRPSGRELAGLYTLLQACNIMRYPLLFCHITGLQDMPNAEVLQLLRTYVDNGGGLYISTSTSGGGISTRGFILDLIQEHCSDSLGSRVLAEMQRTDRYVTGYTLGPARPCVFHPWTSIPMSLLQKTDVEIRILNVSGQQVFGDTLRGVGAGAFDDVNNCYRWDSRDSRGIEAPSGYYLLQIEAGLCRQTHGMRVSRLRKLSVGNHPVYNSVFSIDDLPRFQL